MKILWLFQEVKIIKDKKKIIEKLKDEKNNINKNKDEIINNYIKEEELIYELVDNIIYNQDKIAELTKIIEFPTDNDVYKKEIFYRNLLKKNIRKIDIYEKEKEINEENFNNNISDFNLKLKRIEDELSKINNKLNEIEERHI